MLLFIKHHWLCVTYIHILTLSLNNFAEVQGHTKHLKKIIYFNDSRCIHVSDTIVFFFFLSISVFLNIINNINMIDFRWKKEIKSIAPYELCSVIIAILLHSIFFLFHVTTTHKKDSLTSFVLCYCSVRRLTSTVFVHSQ